MKKLLFPSLAAAAVLVSCQEAELENTVPAAGETFRIEAPISNTKTVYTPPKQVEWATGDALRVIVNSSSPYEFTKSGDGDYFECSDFAPEAGVEYIYHAFYPFSSYVSSIDGSGKTDSWISIPATSSAAQSGLNSTAHVRGVLYGSAKASGVESPVVNMKHLTALLKIDVTNNYTEAVTLRSITVSTNAEGQYLSGRFDVNLNDGTLTPNPDQLDKCLSSSTLGISDAILEAGATASFYLSTTEFSVPVGSTLTISAESDNGTVENVRNYEEEKIFAAGTVNTTTFSFENPVQTIEKLTVEEFIAKDEDETTYYELTGTIDGIRDDYHGNFYLKDETGTVYVFGLSSFKGAGDKNVFETLGISDGDIITVCGTRGQYNSTVEVMDAYYISHSTPPFCNVTPASLSVGAEAGETVFSIESNEKWTITTDNENYQLSTLSGEGNAEITVTYPANETEASVTVVFTVTSESGVKTVTLNQSSSSSETVELFREDFAELTTGSNTSTNGSNVLWDGNANFPVIERAYPAAGTVKFGSSSKPGSITSKEITVPSNSFLTISFDVKGWTSVEGDILVKFGEQEEIVPYSSVMSGDFESKTVTFNIDSETTASVTIGTVNKRAFVDNVVVSYRN